MFGPTVTDTIAHHQQIIKQVNDMTRHELTESLPKLNKICTYKIRKVQSDIYDLTFIKGKILAKVLCKDGLFVVTEEEK